MMDNIKKPEDTIIDKETINEMMKTDMGQDEFMFHIYRTRISYALARIHAMWYPNSPIPNKQMQHKAIVEMMRALWEKPAEEIIEEYTTAQRMAESGCIPTNCEEVFNNLVTKGGIS
jgi:hypothetical protein